MPLALSFMGAPFSLPRGGLGADLVVGAVAADLIGGRRLERASADPRRGLLDLVPGALELRLHRPMASDQAGLEEAQLDGGGQAARHVPLRQRVDAELQTL